MLTPHVLNFDDFVQQAERWDQLWKASASHTPIAQARGLQLWIESFASEADFLAVVVQDDQEWIAGLPLVRHRHAFNLTTYWLPSNGTINAGDLLFAHAKLNDDVVSELANALLSLPGSVGIFDAIEIDTPRWQRFLQAVRQRGASIHTSQGHPVGVVDIGSDWEHYRSCWSGNHRSMIKRCRNKLAQLGEVEVQRLRTPDDVALHDLLETCFAIEDMGWKGHNGTSILKTPGLREHYHREALLMRDYGALDLWLLKLDGKIIAFEYCHHAQGASLSHKISFDPEYSKLSPGRVLRSYQLESYFNDGETRLLDTLGVLCPAKAKWCTRTYTRSRCFISLAGPISNLAINGLKLARAARQRIRGSSNAQEWPPSGAAAYLDPQDDGQQTADPSLAASH